MPSRLWRIAGYLFLAGAALVYAWKNCAAVAPAIPLPSDFSHYYEAGRQILKGGSPYTNPAFNYPPVLAFISAPLALTDYVTARWIWFLACHLMLLGAAFLVWRFLGGGLVAACSVALVWAVGGAAGESLALGQVGPLLTLLVAWAYTAQGKRRGIAIGAGAGLKVLPGILVLPALLARDWRGVASAGVVAALLIVIPAAALSTFDGPRAPRDPGFLLGSPAILSWSVPSTVLRVLDPPVTPGALPPAWVFGNQVTALHLPEDQRLMSAASSIAVLMAGAAIFLWRTGGRIAQEQLPVAMAGVLSLALAAAPVCWSHYQILQYPGMALLLGLAVARRQWLLAGAIAACGALLYPVPVAVLGYYYYRYGWTAASPWQLYVWTSATPAACLATFGLSLSKAWVR